MKKNFFFKTIRDNKWKTLAFILLILIFIFVSFIAEGFFSGRTLVSFLIFLGIIILMGVVGQYINRTKKCVYWYFCPNCTVYNRSAYHKWISLAS